MEEEEEEEATRVGLRMSELEDEEEEREEEVKEEEGAKQVKMSIKEGEEGMDKRRRRTSGKCRHTAEG